MIVVTKQNNKNVVGNQHNQNKNTILNKIKFQIHRINRYRHNLIIHKEEVIFCLSFVLLALVMKWSYSLI